MALTQVQATAAINTEKAAATSTNLAALIAAHGQDSVKAAVISAYQAGCAFGATQATLVDTIA